MSDESDIDELIAALETLLEFDADDVRRLLGGLDAGPGVSRFFEVGRGLLRVAREKKFQGR
jgi:hypothetical protein